ncbi:SRPBCC family protein [Pedobacter glucosidilyticus]|uniref:SRPBCC family protein n=1 Tax=Pedobacter glucosidilyticus TaxID=1122941 RepID=UPI0026EEB076|nr:SRPBCC domain-containing protein [Pedobacter glucosidilyticus]
MVNNKFEIEINASAARVWQALTHTTMLEKWMKNVKVETDWKQGSTIIYTCYDEKGDIFVWNGQKMVWEGIIRIFEENKEFTCSYPDKSTGLVEESYILETLSANKTKLFQTQVFEQQEVADAYQEGTLEMLNLLKAYVEAHHSHV